MSCPLATNFCKALAAIPSCLLLSWLLGACRVFIESNPKAAGEVQSGAAEGISVFANDRMCLQAGWRTSHQ
jgi:hypothetical protein